MAKSIFERQAELCKIFTSPKRIEIIYALKDGEKSVSQLSVELGIPQANLSQHLALLRNQRVLTTTQSGLNTLYKIADHRIIVACNLLREILIKQLFEEARLAEVGRKPARK